MMRLRPNLSLNTSSTRRENSSRIAVSPNKLARIFSGTTENNGHVPVNPGSMVSRHPRTPKRILDLWPKAEDLGSEKSSPSPPNQKPSTLEPIDFPKSLGRRVKDIFAQYPLILQQSSSDCGAACLTSIGEYWGKRFNINHVRQLAGVERSGDVLKQLAKAAENLGFYAQLVRGSFSRVAEEKNPWIARWQGMRYVVVYKIKGQKILIADPAVGKKWLSKREFLENWTGDGLRLDPRKNLDNSETSKPSLSGLFRLLWPYGVAIGLQIFLTCLFIQLLAIRDRSSTGLLRQLNS